MIEIDPLTGEPLPAGNGQRPSPAEGLTLPATEAEADALLERAHWKAIARLEAKISDTLAPDNVWIPIAKEILAYARPKPAQMQMVDMNVKSVSVVITPEMQIAGMRNLARIAQKLKFP